MTTANTAEPPLHATSRRRTGILGGSFDPVHFGHLLMAQDAREQFDLDRVCFIPCAEPPHKRTRRLAPPEHRLAMLQAATGDHQGFEVLDVEIRRGGRSYTVQTLLDLRRDWPGDDFFFIIGDDSLADLPTWYRIDQLLEQCEFITLARPGIDLPPDVPRLAPSVRQRLLRNRRTAHSFNVSSTEIRERLASGRSIRYLVPDAVIDHISRHQLYRHRTDEDSRP